MISDKIDERIQSMPLGAVFIASDFFDLGDYENVRKILNRSVDERKIRRILPGTYDSPRYSNLLGEWEAPDMHEVALALARKYKWSIAPTGNTSLNLLGISTQVPGKWSYISDGRYATYNVMGTTLEFKHRANGDISGFSMKEATVVQAIQTLGKKNIESKQINRLREFLSAEERKELLYEARSTKHWIYEIIREIAEVA